MSLTLPTAYSASSKLSNIQENWIVQLSFFNGDGDGQGEGGWDAVIRTNGSANLINKLGSELVQDGDNPDPRSVHWTRRDRDGNDDGWTDAAPAAYEDDDTASMINTLTGNDVDAGLHYSLTFTVGVAALSLRIGGGDLTGNSLDEQFVSTTTYAVGTHTVTFTADADRTHLWFTADIASAGNGTIDDVTLKNNGYPSDATSIIVDDGTVFQDGDYIKIDDEIIQIVSISTHTLTVVRGAKGTTPASHIDNSVLYWDNFTPIALADTTVDSVFYHGTITNKPSIRSSIDLANSTAKTGNISLSVINFQFKGDDFSAELFLGTRKYINREVRIYSQLNGNTALSNCLQIYSGRLVNITHDDSKVNLQLVEQRPWDFITIPQDKSSKNNYLPIAYGVFTPNASTRASQAFCSNMDLYPCPVEQRSSSYIKGLQPQALDGSAGTEEARLHLYEKEIDAFIPLTKADNTYRDTAVVDGDGHSTIIEHDLIRGFITKGFIEQGTSNNDFSNPSFSVDTQNTADTSTSASNATALSAHASGTQVIDTKDLYLDCPSIIGTITEGKSIFHVQRITAVTDGNPLGTAQVKNLGGTSIFDIHTYHSEAEGTGTATDTSETTLTLSNGQLPINYGLKLVTDVATTGASYSCYATLNVYDARLKIKASIDFANNKEAAIQTLDQIDHLYCGANGLPSSFTGGSGTADTGLEAHRDLLFRFTGFDSTDANIYNYDANLDIEAARITSAWRLRWWTLKPVELKKILEQIQYEFCFIFKFRHDGTGSYWFIKDSYSSGDVSATFKKSDITNLKINNTPFTELLTDMRISYEKHPAENRYLSSQTSKDTTNNPRTVWNIQSKENISEVKLDMNVNKPGNTNVGGNDPNDGFADYYMNIFGDIKKIISCDIINPAVSYNLETGDIVQFPNTAGEMPVEPFGDNWADYYMITDFKRSPGKVSITVREVG